MALKTNYKFLFIGDDKNIFVENYSYDLAVEKKEKGGQLFITIEIRNNLSNAKAIGEKIFNTMRRYLSANLNGESRKRFKNSLKEVNKVLDKLKDKKSSPRADDLNILIGFIAGKDLYLTQMGDAAAYLARSNSIEIISQGLSEKRGDTFTTIAKGEVKTGDFVVFSSVSLFQYISRVDLAKALDANTLIDSLSKLNELISTKISGHAGIIGMTFEKVPELIKETVVIAKKPPHKLLAKILKIKIPKIKIPKIEIPKIKTPKIEIKIPKFLSNIVDSIKNLLLSARHRKSTLSGIFIVAILILILTLGIIWYAKNPALKESWNKTLNQIRVQVFTAVIKAQDDTIGAEAVLDLDKTEKEATKILESGYHETAIKEALALVQQAGDNIDNVRRVENPKVFIDFSTKQPNINPLGLLALKDKFFAFEHNALYEIDLDKIEELATFNDSETIVSATDFENQDSLIFTTKSNKLIQYKGGDVTFMDTTDNELRNGIAIDDWSNRIYILDSESNQIWRYPYSLIYKIFTAAKKYNVDSDLKDAVDFAIDGDIYILNKDGSIDKLYKGKKQDFFIQGEPLTEFDIPSKIYTEDGLNQIFVMDSGASRIFTYAKDLKTGNAIYSGQIVFPTISALRDLYVDKNANKLYLLDAQKVYEVEL